MVKIDFAFGKHFLNAGVTVAFFKMRTFINVGLLKLNVGFTAKYFFVW